VGKCQSLGQGDGNAQAGFRDFENALPVRGIGLPRQPLYARLSLSGRMLYA
jgi:hypothetical protein